MLGRAKLVSNEPRIWVADDCVSPQWLGEFVGREEGHLPPE